MIYGNEQKALYKTVCLFTCFMFVNVVQIVALVSVAAYHAQRAVRLAIASATTDANIQNVPDCVDSHASNAE
jgi:hypothetical protein